MNNKLLYIVGMAFLLSTTANGQQHAADSLGNNGLDAEMIDLGYIKKNRSESDTGGFYRFLPKSLRTRQLRFCRILYTDCSRGCSETKRWRHAEAALNVRGRGGLGDGTPLIIVDGFPRSLNAITLEEVETMSVLKDGAATALYGARGANGVILLTTKRGAYNSFDVDINYKHGFTLPVNKPEMADAYTYARAMNEALYYDGLAPMYSESDLNAFRNQTSPDIFPNVTGWMKEHGAWAKTIS